MSGIPLVDLGAQHTQVADEVAEAWAGCSSRRRSSVARRSRGSSRTSPRTGCRALRWCWQWHRRHGVFLACLGNRSRRRVCPAREHLYRHGGGRCAGRRAPVLVDCVDDTALIDVDRWAGSPHGTARHPGAPVRTGRACGGHVPIGERAGRWWWRTRRRRRGPAAMACLLAAWVIAADQFLSWQEPGAYGDGGAVLTSYGDLAGRVKLLREHGSPRKYEHSMIGFNSRLDTLQAVVLSAKLARLEGWNESRRAARRAIYRAVGDVPGVRTPVVLEGNVPGVAPVRGASVRTGPRAGGAARRGYRGGDPLSHAGTPDRCVFLARLDGWSFPVAERIAGEILSLPLFPEITSQQQERVVEVLAEAVR